MLMAKLTERLFSAFIKNYNLRRSTMDELLEILEKIKPGVDFNGKASLIDDGILDSLAMIRLVNEINDEFDIEIEVTDLVPENFNSTEAIMNLINRLENE